MTRLFLMLFSRRHIPSHTLSFPFNTQPYPPYHPRSPSEEGEMTPSHSLSHSPIPLSFPLNTQPYPSYHPRSPSEEGETTRHDSSQCSSHAATYLLTSSHTLSHSPVPSHTLSFSLIPSHTHHNPSYHPRLLGVEVDSLGATGAALGGHSSPLPPLPPPALDTRPQEGRG